MIFKTFYSTFLRGEIMRKITILIIIGAIILVAIIGNQKSNYQSLNQREADEIEFNTTAEVIGGDNTKAFTYPTNGVGDTTKVKD